MTDNNNPDEKNNPSEPDDELTIEASTSSGDTDSIQFYPNKPMEVHTHSHTPRQKWSHYFWEFLMLFLAVFCGFLAEYKLEHVIENQREATFMHSLMDDLEADEITLANYSNWRTGVNQDFDSLLLLLSATDPNQNAHRIYTKSSRSVLRFGLPDIHEGTIQQLKNSGGLRLVRNKEVLNAINKHYLLITRMKSIYEVEILLRVRLSEAMGEILNARMLIDLGKPPQEEFRLASTDEIKINNFMNSILAAKQINQRLITQLDSTNASSIMLNQLIGTEYDF